MAGLVPAIHVLVCVGKDVDARDKPGHGGGVCGGQNKLPCPTGLTTRLGAAVFGSLATGFAGRVAAG